MLAQKQNVPAVLSVLTIPRRVLLHKLQQRSKDLWSLKSKRNRFLIGRTIRGRTAVYGANDTKIVRSSAS